MPKLVHQSTKTYCHNLGLSCCFRQWRATSHCNKLHGYAIQVALVFEAEDTDERNWVVDFGGLKNIKQFLEDTFDHKTIVAKDDPAYDHFEAMNLYGLIDMITLPNVGCEAFAEHIYGYVDRWLGNVYQPEDRTRVRLRSVEVREHGGNSALYILKD